LRFLVRRCDKDDFRSLRMLITGAEKLPPQLASEFAEKFGIMPLEGYGTTELAPVASANVHDWEDHGWKQIGAKPGTVGQPLPGVAARVVDPDDWHKPLPHGTPGMLLIYGPNVMVGYLHREEETKRVIIDGWYVTGDLAIIDEDGFITITDRLSRFSKIAGEMVPHQLIEEEIHRILNTTERICAVTGIPDEKKGERLVVLHLTLPDLTVGQVHQRLTEGELPKLWLPSVKAFHQVSELPILGSGKLDLQRVKKLALELSHGGD
jgi:acyl-[acyl-carrier-protein]-phospholipid O-acyltransferase/long-chain-fatty-acid--[acyl-carrier-protein] ligase